MSYDANSLEAKKEHSVRKSSRHILNRRAFWLQDLPITFKSGASIVDFIYGGDLRRNYAEVFGKDTVDFFQSACLGTYRRIFVQIKFGY